MLEISLPLFVLSLIFPIWFFPYRCCFLIIFISLFSSIVLYISSVLYCQHLLACSLWMLYHAGNYGLIRGSKDSIEDKNKFRFIEEAGDGTMVSPFGLRR